jgi:hypothetical protein
MFPRVINWAHVRAGGLLALAVATAVLSGALELACWL